MKVEYLLSAFLLINFSVHAQGTSAKENRIIQGLDFFNDIDQEGTSWLIKSIQLPGVRLQYAEQGDPAGTPVVFLHGLSDSWRSFEKVLPLLPSDIHAFAISQRGHGDSERPASGYDPKDLAADLAHFIRDMNLGSVVVVGHSMGGAVAQRFAVDYPHLTKALVIIDSDASFGDNRGFPEFYENVAKLEGEIDRKFMDEFQRGTVVRPIDSAYFNTIVEEGLKLPLYVFQAALKGLLNHELVEELKKVDKPALVFWGDKDNFCFESDQLVLVNSLSRSRLVTYPDTGHALHWEEPQKFVADLTDFIKEIR
jgi:pimeloyl-ACP methyl ester carboxylesterase